MIRSDHDAAISRQEEAIAPFERCSDGYGAAIARVLLGLALLARGQAGRARGTLEDALEHARSTGNTLLNQIALFGVVQSALARHDYEEVGRVLREAIALTTPIGDRVLLAQYLETLAAVAASRGEAERAALLLGASEGLLGEVGASGYNAYDPDLSARERHEANEVPPPTQVLPSEHVADLIAWVAASPPEFVLTEGVVLPTKKGCRSPGT
jgi:hypothetical protein